MRHIAVILTVCWTGPSLAIGEYYSDGRWTILQAPQSCTAYNRDLVEMNPAPYNAMWLRAGEGDGLDLYLLFWPGAFEPSADAVAEARLVGGPAVAELPAWKLEGGEGDDHVRYFAGAIGAELRAAMAASFLVEFRVPESQHPLVFNMDGIAQVFEALDRCRAE